MAKSRPFIINERFRLKELYMVEYPRNSRRSQSVKVCVRVRGHKKTDKNGILRNKRVVS